MNRKEKPNMHKLFLPTELYIGLIKKMAKLEIGKSAAILDCINNDLFNLGFITEETHEQFKKYRKKLIDVVDEKRVGQKQQWKTDREIKIEENLTAIYADWNNASQKAKDYAVKKAFEYPELLISKLIQKRQNKSLSDLNPDKKL